MGSPISGHKYMIQPPRKVRSSGFTAFREFASIRIARSGGWVRSLQLVKILPSKAVRHNANYSSAEASPKPVSCASVLQSRPPWFLPVKRWRLRCPHDLFPCKDSGKKVSRPRGLLPEGLVGGKGTEVSTLVSQTPPC